MKALLYRNIAILVYVLLLPLVSYCQTYNVTTIAGGSWHDGSYFDAKFKNPTGTVIDGAGNVYVADKGNHRIRKISRFGIVTTLAGSGRCEFADGTGMAASFNNPAGLSIDGDGNLYVADEGNHRIRKINPSGVVITFAGGGGIGWNGSGSSNGIGTAASFNRPTGVAIDGVGNLYVSDQNNNCIRKISPLGVVTTLAGFGFSGYTDGIGTAARFRAPSGVAIDADGNVIVADEGNNRIRKISATGLVTTLAGSGNRNYADGIGNSASFTDPTSVAIDQAGNVYVADLNNNRIRKINQAGVVTSFAGSGGQAYADGTGSNASFKTPRGVAVDGEGNVYVADAGNNRIRKINSFSEVTTVAGSETASNSDGIGTAARFNYPNDIAVDGAGNIFVVEELNHIIRKISTDGMVTTFAGSGNGGYVDGIGTAASFNGPSGIAVDGFGNVYVADRINHRIRKISPSGVVTTFAGSGGLGFNGGGYSDGTGTSVRFNYPLKLNFDGSDNLYVADDNRIRKISPAGVVSTVAGSGNGGYVDGIGIAASFNGIAGIAVDASGNVYLSDAGNSRIRKIDLSGVVTTLAGSGNGGYTDGSLAVARFDGPSGLAVDGVGNVFLADQNNNRIRTISSSGMVTTIAGSGEYGFADGSGTAAIFDRPTGISIDRAGNLFVVDKHNLSIRKISNTPTNVKKKSINSPKLKLYPNPTTGIVTLTTIPEAESIDITNAIGQLVYTTKAQPEMELNLNHLAKGVYMVQVQSSKGLSTQRLVIQ